MAEKKLRRVTPGLGELLPTPEAREAFEDASAAIEAGALVRKLRGRLTQTQLAQKLSITQERISAIENGVGRDGPSYALLKRIVVACGAEWPFDEILEVKVKGSAPVHVGGAAYTPGWHVVQVIDPVLGPVGEIGMASLPTDPGMTYAARKATSRKQLVYDFKTGSFVVQSGLPVARSER